jgi:hypothetical protein
MSVHDANDLIKINLRAISYLLLFIILRHEFHHNIKEKIQFYLKNLFI